MATNLKHFGRTRKLPVDSGITSGDPVLVGILSGVALTDRDSDGYAVVDFGAPLASYDLSVKGVNDSGNSAVSVGDELFTIVADTPDISKKASGNSFGAALETVSSGATATIEVLLLPGVGSGTADILAGAIGTSELAADAVTGAKIADDAVDSEHIADGAIDLAHMSANSVDSDQYVDGSIDSVHLANDSVGKAAFAGGINKSELVAGQDETGDATIPVAGLAAGDELVGFFVQDGTSGVLTMRALTDFTVGAAELTVVANAANNAANKYFILWSDLTA